MEGLLLKLDKLGKLTTYEFRKSDTGNGMVGCFHQGH